MHAPTRAAPGPPTSSRTPPTPPARPLSGPNTSPSPHSMTRISPGGKVVPVRGENTTVPIVGLSGTGKTTTTFATQPGSKPAQDDFIALMPGGRVHTTENGCFAKPARFLRVPGTNPFFPRDLADLGNQPRCPAWTTPWSNRWGGRGENRRG